MSSTRRPTGGDDADSGPPFPPAVDAAAQVGCVIVILCAAVAAGYAILRWGGVAE
jgi:hypothetical protein